MGKGLKDSVGEKKTSEEAETDQHTKSYYRQTAQREQRIPALCSHQT